MGEVRGDKGGELGFTNEEGDCKKKPKKLGGCSGCVGGDK